MLLRDANFLFSEAAELQALLSGLGGAGLGWLIGMWLSPMGSSESARFSKY